MLPNLIAFSCYTVNIHLEKWLMRCETKRSIWDLYNKHISMFCIKHMITIFRTLQVNKWQSKHQAFFSFCKIKATKFGTKYEISHKIVYHFMTSSGYIIMIIFHLCVIWFHLDCIMQLKKSYCIATNVSSRKNATTFGDLHDWWWIIYKRCPGAHELNVTLMGRMILGTCSYKLFWCDYH